MNNFKIAMGSLVENKIHGLQGIIVGRSEHLHACVIYVYQPVGLQADGKVKEPQSADEDMLEVRAALENKDPGFEYELGAIAKDSVTGFEGMITVRTEWFGSKRDYTVRATKLHEGKPIEPGHFSEERVELVQVVAPHKMRATGADGAPMPGSSTSMRPEARR